MILLIDNYDSFSYNLFQLVGTLNPDIRVVRNDLLSVPEIEALSPEAILLSPGPGRPADAGICEEAVQKLSGKIPILGVCLGHQAICEAFGGTVGYPKALMHGKSSLTKPHPAPSFRICRRRSRWHATIPLRRRSRSHPIWRPLPSRKTERSWRFSTRPIPPSGCSFIPNLS